MTNSTDKKREQQKETFSINKMEVDGVVYILRFKNDQLAHANSGSYSFQIGIAVPLQTNLNGFPAKEENEQLLNMEEIIEKDFMKENIALFVGAIVGGGMKEFVLYTGKPNEAQLLCERLKNEIKHHELQYMIREDQGWEVYKTYCPTNIE